MGVGMGLTQRGHSGRREDEVADVGQLDEQKSFGHEQSVTMSVQDKPTYCT